MIIHTLAGNGPVSEGILVYHDLVTIFFVLLCFGLVSVSDGLLFAQKHIERSSNAIANTIVRRFCVS